MHLHLKNVIVSSFSVAEGGVAAGLPSMTALASLGHALERWFSGMGQAGERTPTVPGVCVGIASAYVSSSRASSNPGMHKECDSLGGGVSDHYLLKGQMVCDLLFELGNTEAWGEEEVLGRALDFMLGARLGGGELFVDPRTARLCGFDAALRSMAARRLMVIEDARDEFAEALSENPDICVGDVLFGALRRDIRGEDGELPNTAEKPQRTVLGVGWDLLTAPGQSRGRRGYPIVVAEQVGGLVNIKSAGQIRQNKDAKVLWGFDFAHGFGQNFKLVGAHAGDI